MMSPLARALPAMTALQATVALGMFALSVLAPQLGLSVAELAALNTLMFGVGTVGALFAGALESKGFEVVVENTLDAYLTHELSAFQLIVPV